MVEAWSMNNRRVVDGCAVVDGGWSMGSQWWMVDRQLFPHFYLEERIGHFPGRIPGPVVDAQWWMRGAWTGGGRWWWMKVDGGRWVVDGWSMSGRRVVDE